MSEPNPSWINPLKASRKLDRELLASALLALAERHGAEVGAARHTENQDIAARASI